ncbi:MAG: sensor domain-containing protein [Mycobacterium sp.]|nr:sensor domain-containing protein [Mycobacterium sp.]
MRTLMAAAALACCPLVAVPVAVAAPPAPALVLSVEDVRTIAGNADLIPGEQLDSPGGQHQYDGQYPSECHAVFDQDVAFTSGFNEFRSVTYTGAASRAVTQAVAVYPDSFAARDALTTVGKSLRACSELGASNLAVTTQVLDQKTFALCQAQCATLYRAAGPVLIAVSASRFGDSDRIATAVLQQITTRVGE